MVSVTVIRSVIGIIGNVISFGLFLSPSPTFYKIWKRGSVEDFSPIPYLATVLNCAVWVLYGLPFVHPHSILVATINGIGLAIEFIYLLMYFNLLHQATEALQVKPSLVLSVELIFMATVVTVTLAALHTNESRSLMVGILGIIFGTCMYASPLSVMRLVIKTKSVEYMPFYLSLAAFLNGLCWSIYALLPLDVNLLIPNGLGAALGVAQLILYGCYYSSTPKKARTGDTMPPKQEIQLPYSGSTQGNEGKLGV